MKTRITALLVMLSVMITLSACSAGTHSDTGASAKPDSSSSFSESELPEQSIPPKETLAPESSEETLTEYSDTEESDTNIQASTVSDTPRASSAYEETQQKPSSTAQPLDETPVKQPSADTAQETPQSTPEPVRPQPTEKPTQQPTEEPTPQPTTQPAFDIGYWVSYAQSYAQSKGLNLDALAIECWDNPISAGANCTSTESSIISRINRYAKDEDITDVWIWAESTGNGNYDLYIGYA